MNNELRNTKLISDDFDKTVFDDPIYGKIVVSYPFNEIIKCKEFQRLRKITQTGYSYAEKERAGLLLNNRFEHSIGVYHLIGLFIKHFEKLLKINNIIISDYDKNIVKAAMLLHDIGQGPYSHLFEKVTKYPHENRTIDIIKRDSEVNQKLLNFFGEKGTNDIASFIADEKILREVPNNSFFKLWKSLISNLCDMDRIDYTLRDSYYANIKSGVDWKAIMKYFKVIVNSNKEYELTISKDGIGCVETLFFERFRNYRDVYFNKPACIMDNIFIQVFENLSNLYNNNSEARDLLISTQSKEIINLIKNARNLSNTEFVSLEEEMIKQCFNIVNTTFDDKVLKYLTGDNILQDYECVYIDPSLVDGLMKEISQKYKLGDAIINSNHKITLYKKINNNFGIKVIEGNSIKDLSDVSDLIKANAYANSQLFLNRKLLAMINNINNIKDMEIMNNFIDESIKELTDNKEFELKYIVDENNILKQKDIIELLTKNGFKLDKQNRVLNNDFYYDDPGLNLCRQGSSIRVRKASPLNRRNSPIEPIKIKATIKIPSDMGNVFSEREELEGKIENTSFQALQNFIFGKKPNNEVLKNLINQPLINVRTDRQNTYLSRDKIEVCLSWDKSLYINLLNRNSYYDNMIEIEAIGGVEKRNVLDEINNILKNYLPETNKQSKFGRAVEMTHLTQQDIEKFYILSTLKTEETSNSDKFGREK